MSGQPILKKTRENIAIFCFFFHFKKFSMPPLTKSNAVVGGGFKKVVPTKGIEKKPQHKVAGK